MYLGGRTLPKYNGLVKQLPTNESENLTLDGTLYTDWFNRRRTWVITYELLTIAEFQTIQTLYDEQYSLNKYHMYQFDAQSIYVPVKMSLNEAAIKHGSQYVENVQITLKEKNPIS